MRVIELDDVVSGYAKRFSGILRTLHQVPWLCKKPSCVYRLDTGGQLLRRCVLIKACETSSCGNGSVGEDIVVHIVAAD